MRFFSVSVIGVLVDIAIAYGLATLFGMPLWIAATLGFLAAGLLNYVIHESWTFQNGAKTLSALRAFKYLLASVVTLLSRIAAVFAFAYILPEQTLLLLICAAGTSFFINFALSKLFVFSRST